MEENVQRHLEMIVTAPLSRTGSNLDLRDETYEIRFSSVEINPTYNLADFYVKGEYQYTLATRDKLIVLEMVAKAIARVSEVGVEPDFEVLSGNGFYRVKRNLKG